MVFYSSDIPMQNQQTGFFMIIVLGLLLGPHEGLVR
jgi:hypothetical protein